MFVDRSQNVLTSVDHNCKVGYTALHMASKNGHKSAIEMLINHGADVNAVNDVRWDDLLWKYMYMHAWMNIVSHNSGGTSFHASYNPFILDAVYDLSMQNLSCTGGRHAVDGWSLWKAFRCFEMSRIERQSYSPSESCKWIYEIFLSSQRPLSANGIK